MHKPIAEERPTMTDQLRGDPNQAKPLGGLRLLVVEDQFFIAMEVNDLISSLGAEVVGPFARLSEALDAVQRHEVDGAVLDVKLDSERSYPVVDILLERGRPVLLVTGGDTAGIPDKYRVLPCLLKPFEPVRFQEMAETVFRQQSEDYGQI
jgi:DNA-binding NarL/FixJ family response regulator